MSQFGVDQKYFIGKVRLDPGNVTVPLLVPQSLAEHLRNGEWGNGADSSDVVAQRAESLADKAGQAADSLGAVQDRRDEAARVVRSRLGDSLRAEGKRRADSLRESLTRMADSLKGR